MANPINLNATPQTKALYHKLASLIASNQMLLGHQDTLEYGHTWRYNTNPPGALHESDIKDCCGELPAVFGWDLGQYYPAQHNYLINGVLTNDLRQNIIKAYSLGGVNTISWHCDNPDTGGNFNSQSPNHDSVHKILNDATVHARFLQMLNDVADFIASLQLNGVLIPIIFRPLHECNLNNCFWWDKTNCSDADYKALWTLIVSHLKDVRHLNNILFAYTVNEGFTNADFNNRFVQNLVDIIGIDIYQRNDSFADRQAYINKVHQNTHLLKTIAIQTGKIPALTETGVNNVPYPRWWTEVFTPAIKNSGMAYTMIWRNPYQPNDHTEYYAPFKGQASEADFKLMYQSNQSWLFFQKKAQLAGLYS